MSDTVGQSLLVSPWQQLVQPLGLSLLIATCATIAVCLVGIPLAYLMARRRLPAKPLIETLILLPLVLPPTVVGYGLIMLLGARGAVGQWLYAWWDYSIAFRIEGAILAGAIAAMPLVYLPARSAFASVEREMEDVARLMGAGRLAVFFQVYLPIARRGIASGVVLAFARALGEFGATVMVFGWQPGRLTLPISIYAAHELGRLPSAWPAVAALVLLSLVLVTVYGRWSGRD